MGKYVFLVLVFVIGIILGIIIKNVYTSIKLSKAKDEAKKIVDDANAKADNIIKEANLDAKTQAYEYKLQSEKEIKAERLELTKFENQLSQREQNIDRRDIALQGKEDILDSKNQQLDKKQAELGKYEEQLKHQIDEKVAELEKIAAMSAQEAKKELFEQVKVQMENEVTAYIKEQEEEAKTKASLFAKDIIANAINRYSQEEVTERTVNVVSLPGEEMKGRIIGREGRNIRAFESATGAELIIDDTPEVITVSCFDPVRREIARMALEKLIKDGRIQPGRIEEVVENTKKEIDDIIYKAGEDAVFELGLSKMKKEEIRMIGKLKYRTSYGQNGLQHSVEVAHFAGIMAAELGINQQLAKRAGLLHDIGKAMDHEMEGSHVELGAKFAKRMGENNIVINAIASHHGDVPTESVVAVLVSAADTLSAARPGSRSETIENYIQRLEKLEEISKSFDGVDTVFAIQAGREVRVIVNPEKVDDLKSHKLARDIKEKIENELTYPGHIKVTVIREVRANEIAK
ncbi:ribonucrease Y [Kandleria vitulina]|uniref:ribonuclease Y n=1 Tax=Kandleria vitulina TaxID=1630 RepID=UPI0008C42F0A|nr:ribonuclease Y [Kandleria vitulina]SEI71612.1 ribonucrease Y [Kandleria vitulina]